MRVRFQPNIGVVSVRQVAGWIQGRWSDEVSKNAQDRAAGDVATLGGVSIAAELLLMGYDRKFILHAIHRIRNPELQWLARSVCTWLSKLPNDCPGPCIGQVDGILDQVREFAVAEEKIFRPTFTHDSPRKRRGMCVGSIP